MLVALPTRLIARGDARSVGRYVMRRTCTVRREAHESEVALNAGGGLAFHLHRERIGALVVTGSQWRKQGCLHRRGVEPVALSGRVAGVRRRGNYYDRGVAADERYVYRTVRKTPSTNREGYQVVAMEIATGREVWSRGIQGYWHPYEVGEPSVIDGVVYVNREGHSGLSSGTDFDLPRLIRLDAASGEVLSETNYPAQWSSKDRPIVTPNHVLAAGGYYGGLNSYAPDGQLQWFSRQAGDAEFSAVFDGKIFQGSGSVFDLSTGEALSNVVHPMVLGSGGRSSATRATCFTSAERSHRV